jgi:hypothetical protein
MLKAWHVLAGGAVIGGGYYLYTQSQAQKQKNTDTSTSVNKGSGTDVGKIADDVSKVATAAESIFGSISKVFGRSDVQSSSLSQGKDSSSIGTEGIMGDAPPDNSAAGQADSGNPLFDPSNFA